MASDDCSVCYTALCTQCTGPNEGECAACKSGAELTTPGNCVCSNGYYDLEDGNCAECENHCSLCTEGNIYSCQACQNGGRYQPNNTNVCIVTCPLGYTALADTCSGAAEAVKYVFTKITKQWASNGVIFNAGLDDSDESEDVEPYTYKLRGAYFETDQIMTLDVSTGFNLHSLLTIYTWFLPTDVTGTIFSKSHADWTSANTSGFLSIELAPAGVVNFVANLDSNISTPISSAYTLDSWNHLGLIVSYDEATVTTSIQP